MSVLETNPEFETIGSKFFEKEEKEARQYLESVKARAQSEGVICDAELLEGEEPHRSIVEAAKEKKIDMIVVGRRGRRGLAKLLIGEIASKVIGHAPCNVLVVPRAAMITYQKILVATDGSAHANAAVEDAIAIAKRCGSHLILLTAVRDSSVLDEAKKQLSHPLALAQSAGVSAEAATPLGRPHDVIVESASGRGVDLIVMGNYGKTGVRKILMGSATEKVIKTAGCAVLVVKAE